MSILINNDTRLLVQGITGQEGLFHTAQMVQYGTKVVAGVTPGRGGEWVLEGKIPVFDSAKIAVEATGANASVIFVPARFAADAMYEAGDAGIPLIICITEGIPVQEMMRVSYYLDQRGIALVGPNSPGILSPGECKAGIIPGNITKPGNVGVMSRSGTLMYEVLNSLKNNEMGVSSCVGVGGDAVTGLRFTDVLRLFEADPFTEKIVLIGEIGGNEEQSAADYISREMTKPVLAFIAGQAAPAGKRLGHAGAIIDGEAGLASIKIESLKAAGVRIASYPEEIPFLLS